MADIYETVDNFLSELRTQVESGADEGYLKIEYVMLLNMNALLTQFFNDNIKELIVVHDIEVLLDDKIKTGEKVLRWRKKKREAETE